MKNLWHTLTIEKTFEKVDSSVTGLTPNQILERQNKYGKNKLIEKKKKANHSVPTQVHRLHDHNLADCCSYCRHRR